MLDDLYLALALSQVLHVLVLYLVCLHVF